MPCALHVLAGAGWNMRVRHVPACVQTAGRALPRLQVDAVYWRHEHHEVERQEARDRLRAQQIADLVPHQTLPGKQE